MPSDYPRKPHSTLGAGTVILHRPTSGDVAGIEHVVLVQMNYGRFKGRWILPGGSLEPGEHPEEAALREALEETGLEIEIKSCLGIRHRNLDAGGAADVYWVFVGGISSGVSQGVLPELVWPAEELISARLWSVEEALQAEAVRPMTRLAVKLAVEGLRSGKPGLLKVGSYVSDSFDDSFFATQ